MDIGTLAPAAPSFDATARPRLVPLAPGTLVATEHPLLRAIHAWVREYLCRPHPELGRSGAMCPFVPEALQKGPLFGTMQAHVDRPTWTRS